MAPETLLPVPPKLDFPALAQRVHTNRGDLIGRCQQVLRKKLFTNRSQIHPRSLASIATQEADTLIDFLRNGAAPDLVHGAYLCQQGLSSSSVFGLGGVHWDFFFSLWGSEPQIMELLVVFLSSMMEGFFNAREALILKEQENFRLAFQMALNQSTAEIQEARQLAQQATESSYRNIILAQEEERRRISRELHDEAGQALIGIHMILENLLNDTSTDHLSKHDHLEKAIATTDNVLKEIRSLAYNLRPPVLDLLGIHLAIKQLCLDFSEQTSLQINYSGVELPLLADEFSITIYRVVQEGLTNIFKHAKAKHVWVKLGSSEAGIELLIKDDGKGFDPESPKKGLGLMGMQERLRLLKGSIKIESSRGKFSQIIVMLPLVLKTPDPE